ncbi:hypothetical protein E3N88_30155 [Mikania micrantha]|uniref:Uncharacterized protein n=1 Tax=Mikania micrantha TaxID=192012 RepID=A0A5N6MLJ9_9ASTR|nr:hypothetical protein E3N88_30155 [Mikania micrantha]
MKKMIHTYVHTLCGELPQLVKAHPPYVEVMGSNLVGSNLMDIQVKERIRALIPGLEIITIGKSSKNHERRRKPCAKRSSYAPGIAKRRKDKNLAAMDPRGNVSASLGHLFTRRTSFEEVTVHSNLLDWNLSSEIINNINYLMTIKAMSLTLNVQKDSISLEIITIGKSSKNHERRRKPCAKRSSYAPGIAKRRKDKNLAAMDPRGNVSASLGHLFTRRTSFEEVTVHSNLLDWNLSSEIINNINYLMTIKAMSLTLNVQKDSIKCLIEALGPMRSHIKGVGRKLKSITPDPFPNANRHEEDERWLRQEKALEEACQQNELLKHQMNYLLKATNTQIPCSSHQLDEDDKEDEGGEDDGYIPVISDDFDLSF